MLDPFYYIMLLVMILGVCLIESESGKDTSKVTNKADFSKSYGLFQVKIKQPLAQTHNLTKKPLENYAKTRIVSHTLKTKTQKRNIQHNKKREVKT